jgi:hypothetical protein
MKRAPSVPPIGRIHPLVWSKAASEDDNFIRNHLSGSINLSLKSILVIAAGIALFLLLLMLLD